MVFHHCVGNECFSPNHNQIPSNPMPTLRFPTKTHHPIPTITSTATDAIKTFVTTTFKTLTEKEVTPIVTTEYITTTNAPIITEEKVSEILTTTPIPSIVEETTVQQVIDSVTQTVSDIIDSNAVNETLFLDENNFNNRSIVVAVTESINNTGIFENTNNGSVLINSNISTTMKNDGVVSTLSDVITTTTEKVITTVQTATEKAINTVQTTSEKFLDIFSSTIAAERNGEFGNGTEHDEGGHTGLYVILGIIVVILLVMSVVLIYIYVRHRKSNSHSLLPHPYYNVSPKKENVPAPSDHEKSCLNDVYVQYTC